MSESACLNKVNSSHGKEGPKTSPQASFAHFAEAVMLSCLAQLEHQLARGDWETKEEFKESDR